MQFVDDVRMDDARAEGDVVVRRQCAGVCVGLTILNLGSHDLSLVVATSFSTTPLIMVRSKNYRNVNSFIPAAGSVGLLALQARFKKAQKNTKSASARKNLRAYSDVLKAHGVVVRGVAGESVFELGGGPNEVEADRCAHCTSLKKNCYGPMEKKNNQWKPVNGYVQLGSSS